MAGNPKHEARNPKLLESNLKKQSQFPNGHIGVKSYMEGIYGNNPAFEVRKNKANSEPILDCWIDRVRYFH